MEQEDAGCVQKGAAGAGLAELLSKTRLSQPSSENTVGFFFLLRTWCSMNTEATRTSTARQLMGVQASPWLMEDITGLP